MQAASLKEDILDLITHEPGHNVMQWLSTFEASSEKIQESLIKMVRDFLITK